MKFGLLLVLASCAAAHVNGVFTIRNEVVSVDERFREEALNKTSKMDFKCFGDDCILFRSTKIEDTGSNNLRLLDFYVEVSNDKGVTFGNGTYIPARIAYSQDHSYDCYKKNNEINCVLVFRNEWDGLSTIATYDSGKTWNNFVNQTVDHPQGLDVSCRDDDCIVVYSNTDGLFSVASEDGGATWQGTSNMSNVISGSSRARWGYAEVEVECTDAGCVVVFTQDAWWSSAFTNDFGNWTLVPSYVPHVPTNPCSGDNVQLSLGGLGNGKWTVAIGWLCYGAPDLTDYEWRIYTSTLSLPGGTWTNGTVVGKSNPTMPTWHPKVECDKKGNQCVLKSNGPSYSFTENNGQTWADLEYFVMNFENYRFVRNEYHFHSEAMTCDFDTDSCLMAVIWRDGKEKGVCCSPGDSHTFISATTGGEELPGGGNGRQGGGEQSNNPTDDNDKLSGGAIAGISIAAVVVVACAAFAVFHFTQKKNGAAGSPSQPISKPVVLKKDVSNV